MGVAPGDVTVPLHLVQVTQLRLQGRPPTCRPTSPTPWNCWPPAVLLHAAALDALLQLVCFS
ncbi:hypothetical protein [Micromonospora sp. DPT]|uniref:hypothetical protein n=1 Tax=Micromonospora sp. DPT TaxID=3142975 RepID=UPI003208D7AC